MLMPNVALLTRIVLALWPYSGLPLMVAAIEYKEYNRSNVLNHNREQIVFDQPRPHEYRSRFIADSLIATFTTDTVYLLLLCNFQSSQSSATVTAHFMR